MEKTITSSRQKKLPKYLPETEILSILEKAKNEQKKNSYRNYIMMMTLARTGMRAEELINLQKKDIEQACVMVRGGKGGKDRMIPLEHELGGLLGLYTDRMGPRDHVFPMSVRQVRNIIYKYSPVGFDIHPHTFRHSFAVHCLKSGMNLRSIQRILGHINLNTTQIYLDIVGTDIIEDFEKVNWK